MSVLFSSILCANLFAGLRPNVRGLLHELARRLGKSNRGLSKVISTRAHEESLWVVFKGVGAFHGKGPLWKRRDPCEKGNFRSKEKIVATCGFSLTLSLSDLWSHSKVDRNTIEKGNRREKSFL